jgi:hypothetical protein
MERWVSSRAKAAFALMAVGAFASTASAQQLKRIEVKATVAESQFGEVEIGKTVHLTARPNDVEKLAIPVVVKIKVSPAAITLEPVVQAQLLVTGNVTKSRIDGIRDGDRMECTIDLTRLTCERLRGNAASLSFRANIKDLLVVAD